MESALQIPEVLDKILGLADSRTQTHAACTSKLWSEAALNNIWKHLNSVVPLLKLLAPLRRIPYPSMWELEHLPSVEGWERFKLNARRVRSLVHHDEQIIEGRENSHLSFTVFMDLASMSSAPLLPNLRELEWHVLRVDTPFSLVFLFLHSNLRHLSLEIDISDITPLSFNHLLQHLPSKTPELTHFNLYTHVAARDIQVELARCITNLRCLQVVGLPPSYHTEVIVGALAIAPSLIEMRTGWLAAALPPPEESQVEFREGWFRTLERLDFEAAPLRAVQLISNQTRPGTLTRLRLTTGVMSDNDPLERFLSVVASTLPNLTLLSLNMWGSHTPVPQPLVFGTFRPVFACRQITYFEIGYNLPMALEESDIIEMAEAWPKLEDLTLCEDPVLSPEPATGISLSILPLFAERFPVLRELGLFFEATPVPPFAGAPAFKKLRELNVGTSVLDHRHATSVALYISDLCHFPIRIVKGKSAWHVSGVWDLEEDDTMYMGSGTAWAEVDKAIKSIYHHRQEKEKSRIEAAERRAQVIHGVVEQISKVGGADESGLLEAKVKELQAALRSTLGDM